MFDASRVEELGPDTLDKLVREVDVFARGVSADKYRIVRALQAGGEVVAMTGDGINDAAALRVADVRVAMGARGTDVARDVADVVLMTDDFDGIVTAIAQGRTIHTNISKALRFLLATNFSEILVTLAAPGGRHSPTDVGHPVPLDQSPVRRGARPGARHGAGRARRHGRGRPAIRRARSCPGRPCSASPAMPACWPPPHSASTRWR